MNDEIASGVSEGGTDFSALSDNTRRSLDFRVLGSGNAFNRQAGESAFVVEEQGAPILMIDAGQASLDVYVRRYGQWPRSVYITHAHMDHISGLENLYYARQFDVLEGGAPTRLYVPAPLVESLHERVATYPNFLAEGGMNYWSAFQLIPVTGRFWHEGFRFTVTEARHHAPRSAYGLSLPGRFLLSGDSRPIPEQVNAHATQGEWIFHDCGLRVNPSHTGLDDLVREYRAEQRERMALYHFDSEETAVAMEAVGYRVLRPGDVIPL